MVAPPNDHDNVPELPEYARDHIRFIQKLDQKLDALPDYREVERRLLAVEGRQRYMVAAALVVIVLLVVGLLSVLRVSIHGM